jgi:hypothetical protein
LDLGSELAPISPTQFNGPVKKYTPAIDRLFKAIGESPMRAALARGDGCRTVVTAMIEEVAPTDLIAPHVINSGIHVDLLKAALFLWNDDFEPSHQHSQAAQNAEGAYWHAILHRREPDESNSRYWYARVGSHPVFHQMAKCYPGWKPEKFVLECRRASDRESIRLAAEKQVKEFELLFEHTFDLAITQRKK